MYVFCLCCFCSTDEAGEAADASPAGGPLCCEEVPSCCRQASTQLQGIAYDLCFVMFSYYRTYNYKPRDLSNRVYASHEDRVYAIERAEKLQSGLDPDIPSFVKPMLQSHVTGGFWLGLPVYFCNNHLPNHDEFITLLDEDDNESSTKYLSEKTGLSAGWRGFAIDHELVDGDALVFQLIQPTKFKVYIIRVNQVEDSDETPNQVEDSGDVQNVTNIDIGMRRTRASILHTSSSSEAPNVTDIGIGTRRTRASILHTSISISI
ncbi:hypothetical protein ACSBR2_001877 [Camellia fascicularis]